MWNGRPFTVVTPPGKALGDSATALVVGIHGWTQTGKWACQTMAQPYVTQLGVVFLCPQGLNNYLGQSGWNTGSNGFGAAWSADDVSYIRGATSAVLEEFAFADNLAYAIGFSMGGDMALRLSCEASDLFSGFGVVGQSGPWATSGMVGKAWASTCAPSPRARPIITLSGTQDYFFLRGPSRRWLPQLRNHRNWLRAKLAHNLHRRSRRRLPAVCVVLRHGYG